MNTTPNANRDNYDSKAEELYQKGFAYYLKYGKDALERKKQNPQDLTDAISYMEMSINQNPHLAKAMVILGLSYDLKGDKKLALKYLKNALLYSGQLGQQASKIEEMVKKLERK